MTTKLLAKLNDGISLVEIVETKKAFFVLRPLFESKTQKVFLAEKGKAWDLFSRVDDAQEWIYLMQKPEPKVKAPRLLVEGSREWKRREKIVLETYAPSLDNCKNCGSPKIKGYTCNFCDKG